MDTFNPRLSLIAAIAANRVIGRNNGLPWHLPADLGHFKALTLDKPIVMGRRTWESLPGLLPRRHHIVITANPAYQADGCTLVTSLEAAIAAAGDVAELMFIGGAGLYAQVLPLIHRMYLTQIHEEFAGDTFFPQFDRTQWEEVVRENHAADSRNPYPYSFLTLDRKPPR